MLTTDYDEQEGITVPYPPIFDDMRSNHGFVDTRGRPELAEKISEGIRSKALKTTLIELAKKDAPFFTLGCDLGSHEDHTSKVGRFVAGGYLQIMDVNYSERFANDYLSLAYGITDELEKIEISSAWIVRFVHTPVMFKLDNFNEITSSLWIWFYAAAPALCLALRSRENLIDHLHKIIVDIKQ